MFAFGEQEQQDYTGKQVKNGAVGAITGFPGKPQTGDPDESRREIHDQLVLEEIAGPDVDQLVAPQSLHVLDDRKIVGVLPDKVGQDDQEGQCGGIEGLPPAQHAARRREQEGGDEGEQQEPDHVFVQKGHPESNAKPKQVAPVFGVEIAEQDITQRRPAQNVKNNRLEQHAAAQVGRRHQYGECCQKLSVAPCAHFAGHESGQHNQTAAGQGRQHAHSTHRSIGQVVCNPAQPADQRRIGPVAPGRVLPDREIQQSVAVKTVYGIGIQVKQEFQAGNGQNTIPKDRFSIRVTHSLLFNFFPKRLGWRSLGVMLTAEAPGQAQI